MAEEIYRAYVSNVKELEKHRNVIVQLANRAIRENKQIELNTLTKVYALIYSAYVEDSFLKLIHTPQAFTEIEIMDIQRGRNLEEKWKKCVELAFVKINNRANLGFTSVHMRGGLTPNFLSTNSVSWFILPARRASQTRSLVLFFSSA